MTDSNINTITIIGAGNVGSQLCEKLANCNFKIDGLVYNRNKPVEKLKKIQEHSCLVIQVKSQKNSPSIELALMYSYNLSN